MASSTRKGMRKMSSKRSDDPWESIEVDATQLLGRRVEGSHVLPIYWVKGADGAPGLLLKDIEPDAVPSRLPRTRGVSVQLSAPGSQRQEVRIFLLSPGDREVFQALCMDIVAFSASETSPWSATSAVCRRLEHWQALLSKGTPQEMGTQEIRGVIGELCVLLRLAKVSGITSALGSWVAPDEHPQDFAMDNRLIEVKTRLAGSRQQVQISSLEQLEAAELPIWLVAVELAPSEADAAFSLNEIAGQVMALATQDGIATRDRAERLLLQRGYMEKEAYGLERYVVSGSRAFLVGEGFPRLVRSTTDRRIQQATYVLDLTALGLFESELDGVFPCVSQE